MASACVRCQQLRTCKYFPAWPNYLRAGPQANAIAESCVDGAEDGRRGAGVLKG